MNNPVQSGWFLALILIATPVHAAQSKFGSLPPRYNPKAVEYLVDQCVSYRLQDMQTDYAAQKLEQTCLNDVLAYRWTKNTIRDLERERRRLRREMLNRYPYPEPR